MNLRLRWFLVFAAWAVVLTSLISVVLTQVATQQLKSQVGNNLGEVAFQMADKLDRGMFERYRDIQVAASLTSRLRLNRNPAEMKRLINNLQATYSDYAWIGLTDLEGTVIVSTGDLLLGEDVSSRPWFKYALGSSYVGDVHEALLLEQALNPTGGEPLRFVDFAVPTRAPDGVVDGVLGAHLNWRWAQEVENSVLNSLIDHGSSELILIDQRGEVVLGPSALLDGDQQTLGSIEASRSDNFGYVEEVWPNGERYVVGYAKTRGYRNYEGLGWVVLVRQPVDEAFASITEFRWQIAGVSTMVVLLFALIGWFSAERISRPLTEIIRVARLIGNDPHVKSIPMVGDYPEVKELSITLNTLLQRVDEKRDQLTKLNAELDKKVHERTAEVVRANNELKHEINERKQAQHEREKLILELERQAHTDALTKLANRRFFFEQGARLLNRTKRQQQQAALLMFDLDYFKRLNDTYGHAAGDEVLERIGELIKASVRDSDIAARTGGEEFAVLLDATEIDGALVLAERLRESLGEQRFEKVPDKETVTMSLGVAQWDGQESLEGLLHRADAAMYDAKEKGRNQTVTAS